MPYPLVDMILYFFIYSFCGWLMESIYCSIPARRVINRGFLNGPLCPIYGSGVLLILIFLIPVRDTVSPLGIALAVVFLAGAALASIVEYATSWAMEKLFHARWWDYSNNKYNLNGRICLQISIAWGGLATGFLYLIQPFFENVIRLLYSVNTYLPPVIAAVLSGLLLIDIAVSVRVATLIGNKLDQLDKWAELIREHIDSLELPSKEAVVGKLEQAYDRFAEYGVLLHDKAEELGIPIPEWRTLNFEALQNRLAEYAEELRKVRSELMKGIQPLQRRMLKAFPHMKRPDASRSLRDLQQCLTNRHSRDKESDEKKA